MRFPEFFNTIGWKAVRPLLRTYVQKADSPRLKRFLYTSKRACCVLLFLYIERVTALGVDMRSLIFSMFFLTAAPALANPAPDLAPAPSWVRRLPVTVPTDTNGLPVRVLLFDQQADLTRGSVARFTEVAATVQTAAGLGAGNISLTWRPDVDTITVHSLTITRAGKMIDVLSKQKFTVIRRETNLEQATLDGRLTASLLIDGLEVGDIIDLATTTVSRDPTLAGHVEIELAQWNGAIDHAHARLHWARGIPLQLRATPGLPAFAKTTDSNGSAVELSADHVQPLVQPQGAPARFLIGRVIEATDYISFADLGTLFTQLFAHAATIDPAGPLPAQIAAIRVASPDPAARASAALQLVENKIRYVALTMGEGGYVPASAEATWKSRLGDCKAKTALLIALLHGLDIAAVPVIVSTSAGDGLDERLPLIGRFDHVLVRATIAGRDYYLDGTRTGDRDIARLVTPNFHWAIPLLGPSASRLVRLTPTPRSDPDSDFTLAIDARGGVFAPAKAHSEVVYRGDGALLVKAMFETIPEAQRSAALRDYFRSNYDFIDPTSMTANFDAATGIETLSMDGTAKLKWDDNWLRIPGSSLAYKADFSRPDGPGKDAPFLLGYPSSERDTTTVQLPPHVDLWPGEVGHDVDQTIAGVHYHREASLAAGTLRMVKTENSLLPEIDAATARAAQPRLRTLYSEDVNLDDRHYLATDADLVALQLTTPDTAAAYIQRGLLLLDRQKYRLAIADFTEAHRLNANDVWPVANRAMAHFWLDEIADAQSDLAMAAQLEPANPIVARVRGMIAVSKGEWAAAVDAFTTSLQVSPNNIFSLMHRAAAYAASGKNDAALADTDVLLRLGSNAVELRLMRANILRAQGKSEAVLAEADALQREQPHDALAQVTAGKIYAAQHQRDRALAAFRAALATKPEAYIYVNRGEVRDHADFAGRRADIDAALKLQPAMPEALLDLGQLLLDQHDPRAAVATLSAVLANHPNSENAHLFRGIAYAKTGDTVAAQRDFTAAAAADPSPRFANSLCWTKATNDVSLASALNDCNRALKDGPAASFLDSRGFTYLRLGRVDDAIADLDAALKLAPRLAASLFVRSIAWSRKGDAAKAAADRAAAVAIDPDVAEVYAGYGVTK